MTSDDIERTDTDLQLKVRLTVRNEEVRVKTRRSVLVGERVQQPYGDEMLVAPAL